MEELERIKAKLSPEAREAVEMIEANAGRIVLNFVIDAAWLGSKPQWDLDDNFNTTEDIADLAFDITKLAPDANEVWREIAVAVGFDPEDLGVELDDEEGEA